MCLVLVFDHFSDFFSRKNSGHKVITKIVRVVFSVE